MSVIDSAAIAEQPPNTATDLLRELPGVDVIGTGTNQVRPSIRGQRGQRILLLQDGMRLNNARRQQDFGEIPALVDVSTIQRVEVVRGPASVLYGTDAIGGVMNIITRAPSFEGCAEESEGSSPIATAAPAELDRGARHGRTADRPSNSAAANATPATTTRPPAATATSTSRTT